MTITISDRMIGCKLSINETTKVERISVMWLWPWHSEKLCLKLCFRFAVRIFASNYVHSHFKSVARTLSELIKMYRSKNVWQKEKFVLLPLIGLLPFSRHSAPISMTAFGIFDGLTITEWKTKKKKKKEIFHAIIHLTSKSPRLFYLVLPSYQAQFSLDRCKCRLSDELCSNNDDDVVEIMSIRKDFFLLLRNLK